MTTKRRIENEKDWRGKACCAMHWFNTTEGTRPNDACRCEHCMAPKATSARELGNEGAPVVMVAHDRLRAESAALFLLEMLYRDEVAGENGEAAACYAQAIMAVQRATKDEPR